MASVIPLVVDSGRILCLDVGEEKESEIRSALTEVSPFAMGCDIKGRGGTKLTICPKAVVRGRPSELCCPSLLASM